MNTANLHRIPTTPPLVSQYSEQGQMLPCATSLHAIPTSPQPSSHLCLSTCRCCLVQCRQEPGTPWHGNVLPTVSERQWLTSDFTCMPQTTTAWSQWWTYGRCFRGNVSACGIALGCNSAVSTALSLQHSVIYPKLHAGLCCVWHTATGMCMRGVTDSAVTVYPAHSRLLWPLFAAPCAATGWVLSIHSSEHALLHAMGANKCTDQQTGS